VLLLPLPAAPPPPRPLGKI